MLASSEAANRLPVADFGLAILVVRGRFPVLLLDKFGDTEEKNGLNNGVM